MDYETLINGYKHILNTIYAPKQYYERVRIFLKEYKPQENRLGKIKFNHFKGLVRSMWVLGVKEKGRGYFWKLFASTLFKHPRAFPLSITLAVYGFHFRKIVKEYINTPVEETLNTPGN